MLLGICEKYIYDQYYKKGMTKKKFVEKVIKKENKLTPKYAKICWNIGRRF